MSRRRFIVGFYLFSLATLAAMLTFGDFPRADFSHWALVGVLGFLVLASPPMFLRFGRGAVRQTAPPTEEQMENWRQKDKELTAKNRELEAKDLELTLANRRLAELDKVKSEFVSVASHQLRTPLAAVKWVFHMMTGGDLGSITDEQKYFLTRGGESADRIIAVVNNLLDIGLAKDGAREFKFVPVNLSELVDGVVFEFYHAAKEKKIELAAEQLRSNIPPVEADPVRLIMALENIIDNAVKYTKPGGKVTITINDDRINSARSTVEIVVTDTGIGIPLAEQGRIFDRFFRCANAVKMVPDGVGLGLATAREILIRHGGELRFVSKEGEGTSFFLVIPVRQPERISKID